MLFFLIPVQDTEASCAACRLRCSIRGCRYYLCIIRGSITYCGCYSCAGDSYFKHGETRNVDQSYRDDVLE